jgi:hypothetical protein
VGNATANFNDAAVNTVFDKIVSYAMATGRFATVNQHEPKSAPPNSPACSIWIQRIRPLRTSGLAITSVVVTFQVRMYVSFVSQPYDMIDPKVTAATTDFMGALSGDFDFGTDADVRSVDLLGMSGQMLEAQAGYMEIDRRMFRVMTLTVPVLVNDAFQQVA